MLLRGAARKAEMAGREAHLPGATAEQRAAADAACGKMLPLVEEMGRQLATQVGPGHAALLTALHGTLALLQKAQMPQLKQSIAALRAILTVAAPTMSAPALGATKSSYSGVPPLPAASAPGSTHTRATPTPPRKPAASLPNTAEETTHFVLSLGETVGRAVPADGEATYQQLRSFADKGGLQLMRISDRPMLREVLQQIEVQHPDHAAGVLAREMEAELAQAQAQEVQEGSYTAARSSAHRPVQRLAYLAAVRQAMPTYLPGFVLGSMHLGTKYRHLPTPEQVDGIAARVGADPAVPHEYILDGCYARAHILANEFNHEGFSAEKLFVISDREGFVAGNHLLPQVRWKYHVAPLITLRLASGELTTRVMDLSFERNGTLSVAEWLSRFARPGQSVRAEVTPAQTLYPPSTLSSATFADNLAVSFEKMALYKGHLDHVP